MTFSTDLAIVALFSIVFWLYEQFISWPRRRAALIADAPGARLGGYRTILMAEWAFTALVAARWMSADRPWTSLGLALPTGWRFWLSAVLVGGTALLFFLQARSVAAISDEQIPAVRDGLVPRLGDAVLILPRTMTEWRWFAALSVTAGICEELLFRGYAIWTLSMVLGLPAAAIVSCLLFGIAHAYQGRRGAVKATVVGAVMTVIALTTHSVLPVMLIHAIVDLGGGAVGYAVLRARAVPRTPVRPVGATLMEGS